MTEIQYAISVLFPLVLAGCVWVACRRPMRAGWPALALFLGALSVFPIIRFGNLVEPRLGDWTGHFYANELLSQFLTTALPEEWGKGLVAVLVWLLMRRPNSPLGWVSCSAASHCGFALVEGLLGTFGNEGLLKVVVGRSMGATLHCSWGIIAAWFAWRGCWRRLSRMLNWSMCLLFPSVLHSIGNASMMEVPGATDTMSGEELMVVLPGMASFVATWALAGWCLYAARKAPSMPPIPTVQ